MAGRSPPWRGPGVRDAAARAGGRAAEGPGRGEAPPGGVHLDVHTDDLDPLAADVERLGGTTVRHPLGYVVCRSPAGLVFCLVPHGPAQRPHATHWEGGDSLVDLESEHRQAEVERHVQLGAEVVRVEQHWTTLVDPSGRTYCVTDRDPGTGLLP